MSNELKINKMIASWASNIGRPKAAMALIKIGFSFSMAEKLASGRYAHKITDQGKLDQLKKRMSKDGFASPKAKAS